MMHHKANVPTTSPLMDRRNFLVAATGSLLCAPAIVRASSLMPIKVVRRTPLASPVNEILECGERPSAGWAGYATHVHGGTGPEGDLRPLRRPFAGGRRDGSRVRRRRRPRHCGAPARPGARIVEACSDSLADTGKGERKAHWQERKEAYLAHLRMADEHILWVSLADKVHNARTILRDLRKADIGEKVWARFNVPTKQTLWYYHSLADIFCERLSNQLSDELGEIVEVLEAEVAKTHRRAR